MKKTFFRLAVLAWCAAVVLPASLHAQSVFNGSFELSPASTTTPSGGLGWTAGNPSGLAYIYDNSSGRGTTPYGNQWLYLGGGTESQTLSGSFTVGSSYQLVFSAADVMGGTVPSVSVYLSGGVTASRSFSLSRGSSSGTTPLSFVGCRLDFVPTSTDPIMLTIGGAQYPVAIDNVFIVPEPSTWAMLGLGTAVGFVMLRRWRAIA